MRRKGLVSMAVFFLLLQGCATMDLDWPDQEPNLIAVSYSIADALVERLKAKPVPWSPILVATFVDGGKPDRPSNFGRMMADFVASRMSMSGLRVVEMKAGDPIRLVKEGEDTRISKECLESAGCQRAQAVVIGTYTKANRGIYVSTRLVRADNQQIISSVDLHLPLSYELMFLL